LRNNPTIDPGIADNGSPFRKAQLGNFGLHLLVLESKLFHRKDLLGTPRAVDIWSQSHVAFDMVMREIDYSLMDLVLQQSL